MIAARCYTSRSSSLDAIVARRAESRALFEWVLMKAVVFVPQEVEAA
jgi:hypothetical protein